MRSNTINYAVVGGFVLIMLVAFIASIAVLTGRTGATEQYYAVYENVTGVKFGTQILYEGYPIGQVEEVTPVEQDGRMRFRVDLGVQQGWRIPQNSTAQIAAPGLLSAITISISAGDSRTALKPGAQIIGRESANIFAVVSSVASDVSRLSEESIKPLLASFTRMLDGDAPVLLRKLTALASDMTEQMPRIAKNIDQFTQKMNRSSDEIEALFKPENRRKLENMIVQSEKAIGEFSKLAADLSESRASLHELLGAVQQTVSKSRPELEKTVSDLSYVVDSIARRIDAINQNLEGASRNMYEFSRQIRQNPGLLLGSTPPPDSGASPVR